MAFQFQVENWKDIIEEIRKGEEPHAKFLDFAMADAPVPFVIKIYPRIDDRTSFKGFCHCCPNSHIINTNNMAVFVGPKTPMADDIWCTITFRINVMNNNGVWHRGNTLTYNFSSQSCKDWGWMNFEDANSCYFNLKDLDTLNMRIDILSMSTNFETE